jgi:hypothetical protein
MVTAYRKFLLAGLTGAALLFSLAGVATAHSGSVVASETCQSWSVTVSLANNVTADRTVVVATTIPGTSGIAAGHYNTTFGQIWTASGAAPATGTVTLTIYNAAAVEFTTSASIAPAKGCVIPTPFQSFQGETATPEITAPPTEVVTAPPTDPARVELTLIKVLCPSYSVVPANKNPTNFDATGGHGSELSTAYQTSLVNPSTDIPASCMRADGWKFQLYGGWDNGVLSSPVGSSVTTGSDGSGSGSASIWLTASEQALAASTSTSNNGVGLWVAEIQQPSVAAFGALRCYTDINNGDNVENIADLSGGAQHIYCIAYNVLPKPAETATPFQSFQGETATPFQSFQGETAVASQVITPPPTSTGGDSSNNGSTPLLVVLISLAFAAAGLTAVETQRRSMRR